MIYLLALLIFLSSHYGLNLTLRLYLLPLGEEYGTYPDVTFPWVAADCDFTAHQLICGMYTWRICRSESLWSVAHSDVDWCTLLLCESGVSLASKYVPKSCITNSTKLGRAHLLICWPGLNLCLAIYKLMQLDSDVIHFSYCLNCCNWSSSGLSHSCVKELG